MAPTLRKRRRQSDTVIAVSSSDSSSSESEITEDSGSEEEEEEEEEDTDEEESLRMRHKRRAISVEEDEGDFYGRVVDLLKSGKDLDVLKLEECRAYLRKLKLRVSGTKAICVQRIQEHWRIKDGYGDKLYPYSSFCINCTGDVCKGDVVLFKQHVYEKFDKISRTGKIIGKRIIAGRVVKESYGAAKQQHTFTVEILWSKGQKALPALFPLLVKGRNLYRMKTFRQHWEDETERLKALKEKHQRGASARHTRAITKASYVNRALKPQISSSIRNSSKTQREMTKVITQSKKQNNGGSTKVQQNGNKTVGQPLMSKGVQQSSVRLGHLPSDHNIPHSGHNPVNDNFAYSCSNVLPFWTNRLHGEHTHNNYQHGGMRLPLPFTNYASTLMRNNSRSGSMDPIQQSKLSYFYQGGMDPSFPWLTQAQTREPPPSAPYGRPYHWHY